MDGDLAGSLTGRKALQATAEHVVENLTHDKVVRQHWDSKVAPFLLGSIDPWNLDRPLNDYGEARTVYIELYRLFYRAHPEACDLLFRMVCLARAGHPLILIETDAYSQGVKRLLTEHHRPDATQATKELLLEAAREPVAGKLGHSMVLAWDLLRFVKSQQINSADDIQKVPETKPMFPVPHLRVGWRDRPDARRLTVGDITKMSKAAILRKSG